MSVKNPARKQSRRSSSAAVKSKLHQSTAISVEISIDRLAHDGRGIGKLNGKVVFVDQALPNERHLVRVVSQKSKFSEAASELIVGSASIDRAVPVCNFYASCGGCQIQHLTAGAQLNFKSDLVLDQLRRVQLAPSLDRVTNIVSKNSFEYRTRARLSLSHKGIPFAGFKARANSQIVKVDHCVVLDLSLDRCLEPLQQALSKFRPQVLGHIEMIKGQSLPILILRHVAPLLDSELETLALFAAEVNAEIYLQPESAARYYLLDGTAVNVIFSMPVPRVEKPLGYQAHNFSQINPALNFAMIEQALDWASPSKGEVWLDLFCGVGNLTFPFASLAQQVIGVEAIADMVAQGKNNAQDLGVSNCDFIVADLEKVESLRRLPKKIDGVILDPPRAGAKLVVENISRLKPRKILYISCDPATFARDAKTLVETGYVIERIGALDMFPQTMHVETMALFVRQ